MNSGLKALFAKVGPFEGYGVNHEGQRFRGTLIVTPRVEGRGLTIDFVATGENGAVYHKEHSILGLTPAESVSLWVLSNNHPSVVEHRFVESEPVEGADATLRFDFGNVDDRKSFREIISVDLWPNGDLSYRYAWGLPGGEFAERSSVRMAHGSAQKTL